jgi:RimJ/RimL family protein N-acetyltransferase
VTDRVARLTEADWQAFATVRLRALTEALGETDPQFRHEATFTAAQWRRRLREHAQFAALMDDQPIGLIGAQQENPDSVYLYSLWLDPRARGRGLSRSLVAAAVQWARAQRALSVRLRVAEGNAVARNVYRSLGFTETVGRDTDSGELAMSLTL